MPGTNGVRDELRVVAHGEVISPGNDDLNRRGEKRLPLRLKLQRVVVLAENREQGKRTKRAGEGAFNLVIEFVAFAGAAQVVVEGAQALASNAGAEGAAA